MNDHTKDLEQIIGNAFNEFVKYGIDKALERIRPQAEPTPETYGDAYNEPVTSMYLKELGGKQVIDKVQFGHYYFVCYANVCVCYIKSQESFISIADIHPKRQFYDFCRGVGILKGVA